LTEGKQALIETLSKISEDNAHLLLDPSLFKSYFEAMAKTKNEDIEKILSSVEFSDQTFDDVNFINIKLQPSISSKVDVEFGKSKVPVRGLPIGITFKQNNLSINFEAVSQKYELSAETGVIVFSKIPITVYVSFSIDPKGNNLLTTPQKVFFEMPDGTPMLAPLKEKGAELQPALKKFTDYLTKELEVPIKEKFKMLLKKDIEAFSKKLNTPNVVLGKIINFKVEPLNVKMSDQGKIDIEYALKDNTAEA